MSRRCDAEPQATQMPRTRQETSEEVESSGREPLPRGLIITCWTLVAVACLAAFSLLSVQLVVWLFGLLIDDLAESSLSH